MTICESRVKVVDAVLALQLCGTAWLARLPAGAKIIKMPHQVGDEIVTVYEEPSAPETTVSFSIGNAPC